MMIEYCIVIIITTIMIMVMAMVMVVIVVVVVVVAVAVLVVIIIIISLLPSGKRLHNYGKSPFLMGKSTISMAMFNSYG